MRKAFLLTIVLTLYLYSDSYQCQGYGSTKYEAREEAKKSAVASSSTYIKSVFSKNSSTSSGRELNYSLQTVAKGVCRIESGRVVREDGEFLFSGTCIVENESVRETEKIFKEIEALKSRLDLQKLELLNRIQGLEHRLVEVSDKSKIENLKTKISKLNRQISSLPNISNIYKTLNYQIQQNSRVLNSKIAFISTNLLNDISDLENSFSSKVSDIELNIGSLTSDIEKLSHRVDTLEELMRYIFLAFGGIGLLLLILFFRRSKTVTIEKIADISVIDKRVKISTAKKIFYRGEKLSIDFSHQLPTEKYIYIVDINSRNETTLIYPSPIDNNLISPDSHQKLPEIDVVPPYGKDILKIIASPVPLNIPKIVYSGKSDVFSDSRGFSNPNIENVEKKLAEKDRVSDRDIIAHFRGQALLKGFQLSENHIKLETKEE